jgi:hypothetical protein
MDLDFWQDPEQRPGTMPFVRSWNLLSSRIRQDMTLSGEVGAREDEW